MFSLFSTSCLFWGSRKTVTDQPISFTLFITGAEFSEHTCDTTRITLDPRICYAALSRSWKPDNQQCVPASKFCWSVFIYLEKRPHNWRNDNKNLKFSDAENTIHIDAFFSKQKSSEKSELEVDEQSENRPSSSNTVIDFVVQSESRLSASTTSAESQFTHVAKSET